MWWYYISPLILQKLIWLPTRLCLCIFGRLEIKGLENLNDLRTPLIFAVNHSSEIDPFMVPATLPFFSKFSPLFYATREKAFYDTNGWRKHLFGGVFINMWGGYTALTGLNDYSKSLKDHVEIIRDGGSFCIFPEGGITRDGNLQPAKGGIAYLAEAGKCLIIPVAVAGAYRMSLLDFFMFKKRLTVTYGKPINERELKAFANGDYESEGERYKEEAKYVVLKIGELF